MSRIVVDEKLYHDAVTLSPKEWMDKYHIHDGYKDLIEHFHVDKAGKHAFAIHSDMPPKLFEGWTRLFLLGTQLASERKGMEGRPPAHEFNIGVPFVEMTREGQTYRLDDECCATHLPDTGIVKIKVTAKKIRQYLENISYNGGHLPDNPLDPFQGALDAGAEEGFHAVFFQTPNPNPMPRIFVTRKLLEQREAGNPRAHYAMNPAEIAIHDDVVRMHEYLGLKYDQGRWNAFLGEHGFYDYMATPAREIIARTEKASSKGWAPRLVAAARALFIETSHGM